VALSGNNDKIKHHFKKKPCRDLFRASRLPQLRHRSYSTCTYCIIHSPLDKLELGNVTLASMTSVLLWKGQDPLSISYSITPRAQTFAGTAWNLGSVKTSGGQWSFLPVNETFAHCWAFFLKATLHSGFHTPKMLTKVYVALVALAAE